MIIIWYIIHPTKKKWSSEVKERASIYELTTFLIRRVYKGEEAILCKNNCLFRM